MLSFLSASINTDAERDLFTQCYRKFYRALIWQAIRYLDTPSEAEDIVQEVFCIAADNWQKLSERGEPGMRRFLFICTRNRAASFTRRRKRLVSFESLDEIPDHPCAGAIDLTFTDVVVDAVLLEEAKEAMRSMDRDDADAVWMSMQGYSAKEIAYCFGIKTDTVKKRLWRGRKKLKAALEEKGGSDRV